VQQVSTAKRVDDYEIVATASIPTVLTPSR
jgi:hypothetical protein